MIGDPSPNAKTSARFAEPPWTEHSKAWRDLDEKLPPDHLAREVRDAMIHLDLAPLYRTYRGLGKAAHRPDLMLAIVLFELRRGQRHPCQWHQDTHENYALWWLGFGIQPSRTCWYTFRDRAGSYVDTLNARLLHQAVDEGVTTAERGALDGSAVAANASRRRLINEERLQKRLQKLEEVHQLEQEGSDDSQEALTEEAPGWMAKTSPGRTRQQERYEQAQARLTVLHHANTQRIPSERRAPEKIMVSPGDPEAALGLDKDHVFRPLYTVQTLRDLASPLILGYDVLAQAGDAATLPSMIRRSAHFTGRSIKELLVDSGYVTGNDLADCAMQAIKLYGPWKENDWSASKTKTQAQFSKDDFIWCPEFDTYRCPAGHQLKRAERERRGRSGGREEVVWRYRSDAATCQACPLREQCTTSKKSGRSLRRSEHEDLIIAHRAWMATNEAKSVYRLRGQTIEIVFADVKEHRGLRRFSGHGLARVQTEYALEVLLHNLLVFHRLSSQRQNATANNPAAENIAA